MKFGMRKFSPKKRLGGAFKAKGTKSLKRMFIPGYGRKGSGWIKNPKRAAYNYLYKRTTVGLEDLFKTSKSKNNTEKEIIEEKVDLNVVYEQIKEKLLNLVTPNDIELKNLHKYVVDNDYVMISTLYYNVYKILLSQKKYTDAINILVCTMFMKVFEFLPDDFTAESKDDLCGVNIYERHLSKHIKELKQLWKLNNTNISDFSELYSFFESVPNIIDNNIPYFSENFYKKNMFSQKLNKYL